MCVRSLYFNLYLYMEINEIMYSIWIAPLFMMGTLLWLATDKTHGKDGRRKGGNGHEVQRAVNMLSRSESLMLGTSIFQMLGFFLIIQNYLDDSATLQLPSVFKINIKLFSEFYLLFSVIGFYT